MHSLEVTGNIPTFILKLWKLVGGNDTGGLIYWSRNGHSFTIKDQSRFAKEILPLYFKHNNMASFIRQLNMYGFRKVSNIEHGGLKTEDDEVEFFHQHFLKDKEDQLQFIKRKMPATTKSLTSITKVDDFHDIIGDVETIKVRQDSVDSLLNSMKRENEALWREVAILRQKHLKQQQIVEKLLHFLVSIVRNQVVGGMKRKATPLMIDSNGNRKILKTNNDVIAPSPGVSGPIISDITDLEENELPLQTSTDDMINTNLPSRPNSRNAATSAAEISIASPVSQANLQKNIEKAENVQFHPDPLSMVTLPNSILDFDLNSTLQSENDDMSNMGLLDEPSCSGLSTPRITLNDSLSLMPSTSSSLETGKDFSNEDPNTASTDLIISNQASTNSAIPRLTPEYLTFNNHIDGIDAELNWLQDQLYGGGLSIDPSTILGLFASDGQFADFAGEVPETTSLTPKAIMDGSDDPNGNEPIIKVEELPLFQELELNHMNTDTKDILATPDLDFDPSTFT